MKLNDAQWNDKVINPLCKVLTHHIKFLYLMKSYSSAFISTQKELVRISLSLNLFLLYFIFNLYWNSQRKNRNESNQDCPINARDYILDEYFVFLFILFLLLFAIVIFIWFSSYCYYYFFIDKKVWICFNTIQKRKKMFWLFSNQFLSFTNIFMIFISIYVLYNLFFSFWVKI